MAKASNNRHAHPSPGKKRPRSHAAALYHAAYISFCCAVFAASAIIFFRSTVALRAAGDPNNPIISTVSILETYNTQTTIIWNTDAASDSYVVYSKNADLSGSTELHISSPALTSHSMTINNLEVGTKYYFYVRSGLTIDNNSGSNYYFITTNDQTAPTISSVQISPITDTQAVIHCITNEKTSGTVKYGTASGVYSLTNSIDSSFNLSHYVVLTELSNATKYYFVITATDASGNTSTGEEGNFTTLEKLSTETAVQLREQQARTSQIDVTPPVISALTAKANTDGTITVTWTTNEETNSFIEYGTATAYGNVTGNWEYTTKHTLNVGALDANTVYHYRVSSVDPGKNRSVSADTTVQTVPSAQLSNQSLQDIIKEKDDLLSTLSKKADTNTLETALQDQYAFIQDLAQSLPTPTMAGEPKVESTASSATISWTSDKEANSLIGIATAAEYQVNPKSPYTQVIGDPNTYTTKHTVILTNLQPATVYHYQIRSKTKVSQETKSVDFTFSTKEKAFEISSYIIDKTSSDEVIFRWTTNVNSDSAIQYIPYRNNIKQVDEVKTVTDTVPTIIHQVSVPGLEAGTFYDIELKSVNPDGSVATKLIDAFTTDTENAPPLISQIQTTSALSAGKDAKVQTIISWTTNEPATGRVYYRKGVGAATDELPEKTPPDDSYSRRHIVVVTAFDPGAVYQFKVESIDSAGSSSLSKPLTVLTPQKEQTVLDVIINAAEQTFGWLKMFKR
ncbi:MAG: fibronectin type III domain-containing protein [Patescibacteria group bacterium]